ncbi:unnamed protein product [Prunus armeniaca]|uniref:Uncharacterized protein n=1 Tax=Prunus armeniaca TaxID=36596 RepID=A0A6J5VLT6_PRUAR|nr:unnamed protein product [Prunus armeniaca]CAB4319376.1 unnamed protein product [Prunus armeniaca]
MNKRLHHSNKVNQRWKKVNPNLRLEKAQGQFSNQTKANPRNHEQVQAITTLRSGKVIVNKIGNPEIDNKEEDEGMTETRQRLDMKFGGSLKFESDTTPVDKVTESLQHAPHTPNTPTHDPLPFPQRDKHARKEKNKGDIMEQFKNVQINIPLLDKIKQIPSYPNF